MHAYNSQAHYSDVAVLLPGPGEAGVEGSRAGAHSTAAPTPGSGVLR